FAGSHEQGGIGNSVGGDIEKAPPRSAIHPIFAPRAHLLFAVGVGRPGAELLGLLVNENYITVQSRPNELKAHDDILGRRDFRHCIQCSGSTLDDEESGHAADKLESDRTMLMRVVPKGS